MKFVSIITESTRDEQSCAYPCGMLVRLQSKMQHLASLFALLVHQLVANGEQTGEAGLDNLVKVLPVLALD
jgi:hypothetical protein